MGGPAWTFGGKAYHVLQDGQVLLVYSDPNAAGMCVIGMEALPMILDFAHHRLHSIRASVQGWAMLRLCSPCHLLPALFG